MRKGMTSYGKGDKLNGYYGYSGFTVAKCASECSKRSDCQTFELNSFNRCFLTKGGKTLQKLLTGSASTGGICPKGKLSLIVFSSNAYFSFPQEGRAMWN